MRRKAPRRHGNEISFETAIERAMLPDHDWTATEIEEYRAYLAARGGDAMFAAWLADHELWTSTKNLKPDLRQREYERLKKENNV